MKIFHLVLDGWHPENEIDFFNNFEDVIRIKNSKQYSSTYESEQILNSSIQWPKIYSGTQIKDVGRWDKKHPESMSIKDKLKKINRDDFIWNRLSEQNSTSLVFPYGSFASIFFDNLLTMKSAELCTMICRRWGRPSYFMQLGKIKDRFQSDLKYWGLHEVGDSMDKNFSDRQKTFINQCWEETSSNSLGDLAVDLESFYLDSYENKLKENFKIFKKEFSALIVGQDYLHIGLIETDTIYHYASIYPSVKKLIRKYIFDILNLIHKKYNPDCILIHGDHNMVPITEKTSHLFPDRPLSTINYNGTEYQCIKSRTGYAPIYHEHGNKVGGILWAKKPEVLDIFDTFIEKSDFITAMQRFILVVSKM